MPCAGCALRPRVRARRRLRAGRVRRHRAGAAARLYFLTGERFGADVALRIGLVQEVAEDAGEAAEVIVGSLLKGGPEAVRAAKRLVRERPQGIETARIAAGRPTKAE